MRPNSHIINNQEPFPSIYTSTRAPRRYGVKNYFDIFGQILAQLTRLSFVDITYSAPIIIEPGLYYIENLCMHFCTNLKTTILLLLITAHTGLRNNPFLSLNNYPILRNKQRPYAYNFWTFWRHHNPIKGPTFTKFQNCSQGLQIFSNLIRS